MYAMDNNMKISDESDVTFLKLEQKHYFTRTNYDCALACNAENRSLSMLLHNNTKLTTNSIDIELHRHFSLPPTYILLLLLLL